MFVVLKNEKPQKAVIYYDELNNRTDTMVSAMTKKMDKIIYQNIVEGLSSVGFIVDEDYFDVVDFVNSNKTKVTTKSKFFGLIVIKFFVLAKFFFMLMGFKLNQF